MMTLEECFNLDGGLEVSTGLLDDAVMRGILLTYFDFQWCVFLECMTINVGVCSHFFIFIMMTGAFSQTSEKVLQFQVGNRGPSLISSARICTHQGMHGAQVWQFIHTLHSSCCHVSCTIRNEQTTWWTSGG